MVMHRYRKSPEEQAAAFKWDEPCPWWSVPIGTAFNFSGCVCADRKTSVKGFLNRFGQREPLIINQSSPVTPVHEYDACWGPESGSENR